MKTCTSCGAEVAEDGKFCSECGATLVAAPPPSASVAPPPPPPAGYAPAPPPPPPAAFAPAPPAPPVAYAPAPPPPYPPAAYPPAAQPSPKGNQALIIAAVAVVVVAAGVGSWLLFFNKPATDTGKPNVAQTTTTTTTNTNTNTSPNDSADAAGVVEKLNNAINAGDSAAWDSAWDGTAVAEYLQPILVDAVENGDAWSEIVAQVGSESEARTRLEDALTVSMLEEQLKSAIFGDKALFGTVEGTTVNGSTATVSTVDGNGDAIALKVEKRPTGWVVVGFDSDVFVSSFVTSFEDTALGR